MAEFEALPWWQQRMYIAELSEDRSLRGGDGSAAASDGEQWDQIGEDDLSEHFTFNSGG